MTSLREFRIISRLHKSKVENIIIKQTRGFKKSVEWSLKERNNEIDESLMIKKILESNTEITRDHLTPELRLRLLTPKCRLYNSPVINDTMVNVNLSPLENLEKRIFHDPFWSIYWPGGQALTRFILDNGNQELLNKSKNKTTTNFLDLGSGCGASAIAAKIIGATKVVANDINEVACLAAKLNAKLNNVDIEVSSKNLLKNQDYLEDDLMPDVILVGDLLYDEETAEALIPWLEKMSLLNGSRIFLGDPGRHGLTEALKSHMKLQRTYSLPDNVRRENYGYNSANVYQYKI